MNESYYISNLFPCFHLFITSVNGFLYMLVLLDVGRWVKCNFLGFMFIFIFIVN